MAYQIIIEESESKLVVAVNAFITLNPTYVAIGNPVYAGVSVGYIQAVTELTSAGVPANVTIQGTEVTYVASASNFASGPAPQDFLEISGSGTKKVKVKKIILTATRTAAGNINLICYKRSTLNTGGTFAIIPGIQHDSSDTVATAVVKRYTANPLLGALIGEVATKKGLINTSTGAIQIIEFDFESNSSKPIILNGVNESLCVNLNGVTIAGVSWNAYIVWSEV